MKKQAIKEKMRLADLIAEASYLLPGRIKNKDRNKTSKHQSQGHGTRGAEIWGVVNQEDLCDKLSEKLQLPQKDLNYLCKNSYRFLGASTTENNQHLSKPTSLNEIRSKGQEVVADMLCKPF